MNGKSPRQALQGGILIVLLVLIAYFPALDGGFIWDDDAHLTENPCIVGPLGFAEIWTSSAAVYYPLVLTSFWIQHSLWGLHSMPYHLVSILMQAACAMLLWRVLLNLKVPGAWLGAVLWAVHPVQVESVAWVTELKNTQSCLFYLLAILLFLKWRDAEANPVRTRGMVLYALVLACAILAILSKASTVMLPVVLGLCAWWMDRRWRWHTAISLVPLFLISGAASGWTIWEQKFHSGALGEEWSQNLAERIVIAGNVVWFYLGKLAWPHPIIFIYPRWEIDATRWLSYLPAATALAALLLFWWRRNGWARAPFFAYAYFVVSLFPVLGFFNVYFFRYSFVGDHFQYLAAIGPLVLAGAAVALVAESFKRNNPQLGFAVPAALIAILSLLTLRHTRVFRNDETLWRDTMAKNPEAWLAHNNLGTVLLNRGDLEGAITQFHETLRRHPNYTEGEANLGNALADSGRMDEAIGHYRLALEHNHNHAGVHNALGVALVTKGRTDEAVSHFREAVRLKPSDAHAHDNLGSALAMLGNMDEAIAEFDAALRLDPRLLKTRMNYGSALATQGKYAEAVEQYSEVLRVSPASASVHKNLGAALLRLGQTNEAAAHFREALRLDPKLKQAKQQLESPGTATGQ